MAKDLISLRDSLTQYEQQDELLKTALTCYRAALGDVERHIFHLYPEKLGIDPPSFREERKRLDGAVVAQQLTQVKQRLARELKDASARLEAQLAGTVELSEVVTLLEDTATSLRSKGETREKGFVGVAESLKSAAQCQTVEELKARLQKEVGRISTLVTEMRRENEQLLSGLDKEMGDYRRKLDDAERKANTDALTGLENRRGLEARVRSYAEAGMPFTIMILDLNRFKTVNDKFGHLAGDKLLEAFSQRLRGALDEGDHPARWGGDEFVILMECSLRDAIIRTRQIEQKLNGTYRIEAESGTLRLNLSTSIGLAEARKGETAEQVFSRADALLYREKQKS
jgi:diguanylate cyclase (GGDEF)-like protein